MTVDTGEAWRRMSVMTTLPQTAEGWTVDDVDRLPDDGLQYELLDGVLLVTPGPTLGHQRVQARLLVQLHAACTAGFEVLGALLDWRPGRSTSLQPDLLVVRSADVADGDLSAALVLAVEVLSPSTSRKDRVLKRSRYEEAGVPSYWLVDPAGPSLHALDLIGGRYQAVAEVSGSATATLTQPFLVTVTPADLVSEPR